MAEQANIEARLHELEGMRDIQIGLELTHISEDEQMHVDKAPGPPRPIEAKLRALEKFVRVAFPPSLLQISFFIHLYPVRFFFFQEKLILFVSGQRISPTKWRQGTSIIIPRSHGT
jgi:hypothetical protein